VGDGLGKGRRQGIGRRYAARFAALGGLPWALHRTGSKAQPLDLDPVGAQALEDHVAEQRELGGPGAGGGTDEERASFERERHGAFRDARTDRRAPERRRDRRAPRREPVFPGPREDRVDRLGDVELLPAASHSGQIAGFSDGCGGGGPSVETC